ncbi:hypothetical protein AB0M50_48025, partial [Nonomuraea fuscirosea]
SAAGSGWSCRAAACCWPSRGTVLLMTAVSAVAVAALAVATGGMAAWPERLLAAVAAVLLLFLEPVPIVAGLAVLAVAAVVHLVRRRRRDPA